MKNKIIILLPPIAIVLIVIFWSGGLCFLAYRFEKCLSGHMQRLDVPSNNEIQTSPSELVSPWITYKNDIYHYQISYPSAALFSNTNFNQCQQIQIASGTIKIDALDAHTDPCNTSMRSLSGDIQTTDSVFVNGTEYIAQGFISTNTHQASFHFNVDGTVSITYFTNPNFNSLELGNILNTLKAIIGTFSITVINQVIQKPVPITPIHLISPKNLDTYKVGDTISIQWIGDSKVSDMCDLNFVGPLDEQNRGIQFVTPIQEMGSLLCSHNDFSWKIPDTVYIVPGHYHINITTPYNIDSVAITVL